MVPPFGRDGQPQQPPRGNRSTGRPMFDRSPRPSEPHARRDTTSRHARSICVPYPRPAARGRLVHALGSPFGPLAPKRRRDGRPTSAIAASGGPAGLHARPRALKPGGPRVHPRVLARNSTGGADAIPVSVAQAWRHDESRIRQRRGHVFRGRSPDAVRLTSAVPARERDQRAPGGRGPRTAVAFPAAPVSGRSMWGCCSALRARDRS